MTQAFSFVEKPHLNPPQTQELTADTLEYSKYCMFGNYSSCLKWNLFKYKETKQQKKTRYATIM